MSPASGRALESSVNALGLGALDPAVQFIPVMWFPGDSDVDHRMYASMHCGLPAQACVCHRLAGMHHGCHTEGLARFYRSRF